MDKKCGNRRRVNKVEMGKHLVKNGFTSDCTRWVHHGEAHRMREKLLRALKMPYEQIHTCSKGCVLFRKEHKHAKFCPKCKSSRYLKVDS